MGTRVLQQQRRPARDDVLAEGVGERRLPQEGPGLGQADHALEELPVRLDQREKRDRHAQKPAGEAGQAVERLIRRRVEQAGGTQRLEPGSIVQHIRRLGFRHASRFLDRWRGRPRACGHPRRYYARWRTA